MQPPAPVAEGAEEEIVEAELEVSGGTLEMTQLAAAQAAQAKAQEPAAAAAEHVKAATALSVRQVWRKPAVV